MVQLWWAAAAVAVPAIAARTFLFRKDSSADASSIKAGSQRRRAKDAAVTGLDEADEGSIDSFVCERVCASKRMLQRVGPFSKDPTPDSCVTVCGLSAMDACTDACSRVVCVTPHHVPNWNEVCMRRCQDECLRGQ